MYKYYMISMYQHKERLTESKYGWRFDQYKTPFKMDGKKIVDNNGKELAEVKTVELGKELVHIFNDLQKIREPAERIASLWR